MKKLAIIAFIFCLVIGCVQTRSPQPVAVRKPDDSGLTCEQIAIEYKTNTEVAASKISENRSDDLQDILLDLFIWPGLADLQNADGTEGNALLDRNVHLRKIAEDKKCNGIEQWLPQPERYSPRWKGHT